MTGEITVENNQMVKPGDNSQVSFSLQKAVGIESGMRFAIREGGRTIGAGIVTDVA